MFELLLGIIVLAVAGIAYLVFSGFNVFNRLMALDERCTTAFSDIDVLMKHRHSLIPGLLETVKGFVGMERDTINAVIASRNLALRANTMESRMNAEIQFGQTLNNLMQVCENYPELRSESHFVSFRNSLTDVENRITAARRFYNNTVEEHNRTLRQFPGNVVGTKMRLSRREQFNLGVERMFHDEPVAVQF